MNSRRPRGSVKPRDKRHFSGGWSLPSLMGSRQDGFDPDEILFGYSRLKDVSCGFAADKGDDIFSRQGPKDAIYGGALFECGVAVLFQLIDVGTGRLERLPAFGLESFRQSAAGFTIGGITGFAVFFTCKGRHQSGIG